MKLDNVFKAYNSMDIREFIETISIMTENEKEVLIAMFEDEEASIRQAIGK